MCPTPPVDAVHQPGFLLLSDWSPLEQGRLLIRRQPNARSRPARTSCRRSLLRTPSTMESAHVLGSLCRLVWTCLFLAKKKNEL